MRMMKELSPDKSAGRRRGVMGLRKNLLTSPRLRDALSRAKAAKIGEHATTMCQMSKCGSWEKKWIRVVAWCLGLDGRGYRDECAKPAIGRARNLSDGIVAVFFMVLLQETEMRKALQENNRSGVCMWETRMKTHDCSRQGRKDRGERYDNGPLRPTPAQAGMLLRRGWFGRLREGFVPNIEMKWVTLPMS